MYAAPLKKTRTGNSVDKLGLEMDVKRDFGGSLPVENVQELASKNLKDIPIRYIRPELQLEEVSFDESLQIPVIDMNKFQLAQDDDGFSNELAKLHLACKDWGFFQVINHGVPKQVIEHMKVDVQEFFKLPLQQKMTCAQLPNSIEGYGQAFVVSEEQKLDWGDMLFLRSLPVSIRSMTFWPPIPSSFSATLEEYSFELQKLALYLLRMMSRNLGLDWETFGSIFQDGTQGIRMNYYPPCTEANKVMGLTPHSDSVGLTILVQVNEVQGLQIRKNGKWVPIKPIPDAFVINIGDMIEIISNGEYKSIEHRAVVNPEKERLSIAAFHTPNIAAEIGPLPALAEKGANYKTYSFDEYVKLALTRKLDGKSLLNDMKC